MTENIRALFQIPCIGLFCTCAQTRTRADITFVTFMLEYIVQRISISLPSLELLTIGYFHGLIYIWHAIFIGSRTHSHITVLRYYEFIAWKQWYQILCGKGVDTQYEACGLALNLDTMC